MTHRPAERLWLTMVLGLLLIGCTAVQVPTPGSSLSPVPSADGQPTTSAGPTATARPGSTVPSSTPPGGTATPGASSGFDPDAVRLSLEPFASGFEALTFVTHAGDGSGLMYAVEQRGVIHVVAPDGAVQAAPFLDIVDRVGSGGERGLLGLAFHRDYESNGRFFVNYTDRAGDTIVSEIARAQGSDGEAVAAPESERFVIGIDQPFANHNGGMIAFGSDGYLYIGMGDGGGGGDPQGNGQNMNTRLGKMLRIDVDFAFPYGIPPDNPFATGQPEIWSLGLRNPWRFSFDRQTGDMFIGDVGQGALEEIDVEPAGEGGRNYGWNIMEGTECFSGPCDQQGLTLPVLVYGRGGNCAVTGGYVYRGTRFPELNGAYIYSDYCGGRLWAIDAAAALAGAPVEAFELGFSNRSPSSFGEDEAGELYLVHHPGEILRIVALRDGAAVLRSGLAHYLETTSATRAGRLPQWLYHQ